jgi:hypothetical protein
MLSLLPSSTYTSDSNLFLFDLICNSAASLSPASYSSITQASSFNPANFDAQALSMLSRCIPPTNPPVIVGVQEWPLPTEAKGMAFAAAMAELQLNVLCPEPSSRVALVYSQDGPFGKPEALQLNFREIMEAALAPHELDEKSRVGFLKTTVAKSMAAKFPGDPTVYVVMHAKEPKTAAAATALADYVGGICTCERKASYRGGLEGARAQREMVPGLTVRKESWFLGSLEQRGLEGGVCGRSGQARGLEGARAKREHPRRVLLRRKRDVPLGGCRGETPRTPPTAGEVALVPARFMWAAAHAPAAPNCTPD